MFIIEICKLLNFDLNQVTPLKYLKIFSSYYPEEVNKSIIDLCPLSYLDNLSFQYTNKNIALGILLYICEINDYSFNHIVDTKIIEFKNKFVQIVKRTTINI